MSAIHPAPIIAAEPIFVDKPTAARLLGNLSVRKLMGLVSQGRINAQTIDGRTVFALAEIRRFAADCPSWEPSK